MRPESKERREPVIQNQVDVVGGKAQNLLTLTDLSEKMGFEVPAFRVIPIGVKYDDAQLHELFESLSKPLAIRSSSPYEDSEGLSFAGRFESFLGVNDFPSFRRAVEDVQASARGSKASDYAQQHGVDLDERMAVIVQEMVDPLYSGVCYSTASLDDPRAIVEFVHGLSDELMSGDQQGSIASFDQDFRLTMEHGSKMPNLEQVARVARDLEVVFGQRLDVEFAVSHDGRIFIVQARPATDPEWEHVDVPEIDISEAILNADIVRGAGTFSGAVFVFRSPTEMQRYAASQNRQPMVEVHEQWLKLREFNRSHPEGFCLVADNLEAHELLMQDGGLSNLRALVTVDYASRFSHPAKVVSETGAFYLGVVGRSDLLEVIETGDTLTVASDQLRGVVYDLVKPEVELQIIDLTGTPMVEYEEAMGMQYPPYEDVDDRVFLDKSGGVGVRFWDYNEEDGVPIDVFYDLVDMDGTVLAKGEYRSGQVMRKFSDFPSLLNSLLLSAKR
jgi:hypothetical protein